MPEGDGEYRKELDPSAMRNPHSAEAAPSTYRFTLRDVALAIIVVSIFCAACVKWGSLGFTAATVILGMVVAILGFRWKSSAMQWLGSVVAIVAILFLPLTYVHYLWGPKPPADIRDEANWPAPVQRMIQVSKVDKADLKVGTDSGWMDPSYCWRVTADQDQANAIVAEFKLRSIATHDVSYRFWQDFPADWRPIQTAECVFFANTPPNTVSDNYILMYDPQLKWLYMWYWFNF